MFKSKRMQMIYVCLSVVVVLCAVLDWVFGPTMETGLLAMSMMAIGSVNDVSDRDTHGSNLAYQVYLIDVNQVNASVPFPVPNKSREVGQVPMKKGEYMQYFMAHDIPTFSASGEKGDITTTGENLFDLIMGGMRSQLLNFLEQHAGGKFILIFHEIGNPEMYILGSYDRPMILSSYEAKNDKDGRYVSLHFKRTSIDHYYIYTGAIVSAAPGKHTQGQTKLTVTPEADTYAIPSGASNTYAIGTVSGLTANDKGRTITLIGEGTGSNDATVADNTTFILEDGVTWTAKAGSRITFRVLDPSTLVEVAGSRVQTA